MSTDIKEIEELINLPEESLKELSNVSSIKKTMTNSYISLPTILLHFTSLTGNILGYFLKQNGYLNLSLLISTMSCYAHFTVAHDAIHGSVSKNKYINDTFGILSQFWLGPTTNWIGLKKCHLQHHAHTNEKEYDPDIWSSTTGPGGPWLTPLRWITIDLHYWYFIPKIAKKYPIQFIINEILILMVILLALYYNKQWDLLYCWVLPSRLALGLLAFAFDFLPHYPHKTRRDQNKYLTTCYLECPKIIKPLVSCLILGQNYHYTHHLHPSVPFYKYYQVWYAKKDIYLKYFGTNIIQNLFKNKS